MPPKNDKNQNKTSMVKAMGPFRDSRASSWLPGPRTDVPTEPPSHRPCRVTLFTNQVISHECGTERIVITTNGTHSSSFVTQISRNG